MSFLNQFLLALLTATVASEQKGILFRYYDEICCDGVVYPKPTSPSGASWQYCCGKKLLPYDYKSANVSICCNTTIHSVSRFGSIGCCGNDTMDTTQFKCLMNKKIKLTAANRYGNLDLCGEKEYSYNSHMCCRGVLTKVEPNKMCCGNGTFIYFKQLCCNDTAMDRKTRFHTCCGMTTYDTRSSAICCQDVLHWLPDGYACCGNATFDNITQICCMGKVFARNGSQSVKCCGSEPFQEATHKCCQEIVGIDITYRVIPYGNLMKGIAECCHDQLYSKTNQVCYDDGPRFSTEKVVRKCCGQIYVHDRSLHVWVPDEGRPSPADWNMVEGKCENDMGYCFDGNYICYKNQLFEGYINSLSICYSTPFHVKYQACCYNGLIIDKTAEDIALGRDECCVPGIYSWY